MTKRRGLMALAMAALMASAPAAMALSIAVIGDSIASNYCSGLKQATKGRGDVQLTCLARPSTGLTRDDFYDWGAELPRQLSGRHIDVAIVSMGANDAQNMTLPGHIARFGDAKWQQSYGERVDRVIGQLKAAGVDVYWIGLPNVRPTGFARKLSLINDIYRERTAAQGATFIPLWERTSDGRGYTPRLAEAGGRPRDARQADGIHFNAWGEHLISCEIAATLSLSGDC